MREGLYDFSVEAGLPRILYGTASSAYVESPVGSASLRGGLYDWLTLEAHGEGGSDLLNAGVGTVTRVGSWGVLSLAGSGSRFGDMVGFQSYAAYDMQIKGVIKNTPNTATMGATLKKGSGGGNYVSASTSYVDVDATNLGKSRALSPFGNGAWAVSSSVRPTWIHTWRQIGGRPRWSCRRQPRKGC